MQERLKNYARLVRLHQPIGIWLLFLPCLFGIFLALKKITLGFDEIARIVFLFFIGSVVMRSAGCIINDMFDQEIDEKVERTKIRPLAAKKVSRREAMILLNILLLAGFVILLQFNIKTVFSGFFAFALVATYPLMKRITYYPQVFLGLTFNFGIIMASLAILEKIDFDFIVLYAASIMWTLIYDTIYAYQDVEDDLRVGVKSTAVKFGPNPQKILLAFSLTMFLCLIYLGWKSEFRVIFFLIMIATSYFLTHKIKSCDFKNPQNCLAVFKANLWIGILIFLGILVG